MLPLDHDQPDNSIQAAFERLVQDGELHAGNTVVVVSSIAAGDKRVESVQMRVV